MKSKEDLTRLFDAAIDATAQANNTQDELYSALYRMYAIENRILTTVYEEMVADLQQYLEDEELEEE